MEKEESRKNEEITTKKDEKVAIKKDMIKDEEKGAKKDMIKIPNQLIPAIVIILIVALVIFTFVNKGSEPNQEEINPNSGIAAIVNGEVITVTELNTAFDSLPPQYKAVTTKESLLNQLVQAKIFYQEAKKQGLLASQEEAEQMLQIAKLSSGLSDEQFAERLSAQGLTEQELVDQYSRQLAIQRFLNENLLSKIEVTEEEIETYYEDNLEQFQIEEGVTVRHILIMDENLSEEEQDAKASELLQELTIDNFCDFVTEHSADEASIPNCGQYTFTQSDAFVEEFKQLSFSQEEGEMGIVRSQFGPHIIWTIEKTPGSTILLEESTEGIIETIQTQKGGDQYASFYEEVSKYSVIEIKLENI